MKIQCNNCGLIIEGGLKNTVNHVFNECEAISQEKVSDMFHIRTMPFASFTSIEEETQTNESNQISKS